MKKMFATGIMLVVLLGGAFAFFGAGMGKGIGERASEVSDEIHFEMMKAMQGGDYSTAKELQDSYGIGPSWLADEKVVLLKTQMHEAVEDGDYETFSTLREQMKENIPEFGKRMGKGMRRNGTGFGCPYAQSQ